MIGGSVPDHDLDPPWVNRDEDWEDIWLRRVEDDIDRDRERRWGKEERHT